MHVVPSVHKAVSRIWHLRWVVGMEHKITVGSLDFFGGFRTTIKVKIKIGF